MKYVFVLWPIHMESTQDIHPFFFLHICRCVGRRWRCLFLYRKCHTWNLIVQRYMVYLYASTKLTFECGKDIWKNDTRKHRKISLTVIFHRITKILINSNNGNSTSTVYTLKHWEQHWDHEFSPFHVRLIAPLNRNTYLKVIHLIDFVGSWRRLRFHVSRKKNLSNFNSIKKAIPKLFALLLLVNTNIYRHAFSVGLHCCLLILDEAANSF